jgi:PTS system mannose-specific IIA component
MIGLVVVAHGGLAEQLLAATEHVVGKLETALAVAIDPADDIRAKQREVAEAVAAVDQGDGVVVITDMFGGTPANLAMGALSSPKVEVIYGANLPLLVKLATRRDGELESAVSQALEAGRKYIDSATHILQSGS